MGCPGAAEPGPDGRGDGPRPVLDGQPDLGGRVSERPDGRTGIEGATATVNLGMPAITAPTG